MRIVKIYALGIVLSLSCSLALARQTVTDPPKKIPISAQEMAALLIENQPPQYPRAAKKKHIQGTVIIQATISKAGIPQNISVVSGPDELRQASIDAISAWRYKPYLLKGQPVAVDTTIKVVFALGSSIKNSPAQNYKTPAERWSKDRAKQWYKQQPWLVGADYLPSDAINQLEMFQAATWNPDINDRELGLAESIGMNTMRVFLQDQLWEQDPEGFKKRLDEFLTIAARHHIRPIFVLFDSCWDPIPHLGPQHAPVPGVHNSGWVQSPGMDELANRKYEPKLEAYVKGVVGAFATDPRVLAWDIWNEPDSPDENYAAEILPNHVELVNALLPKVFGWARSVNPAQPLTSGVWDGDWSDPAKESATTKIQLLESDVISFHNYGNRDSFKARVKELKAQGRPILCTEYMARGNGSTFEAILPIAKKEHVAAINWGLVAGKMQTYLPWDSWEHPYVKTQPKVWHHDIFHTDGTPYSQQEVDLIRKLTNRTE
jgi:TonB family protein